MIVRRRPLLRAAVVGGGAYMIGKRSGARAAERADQGPAQPSTGQAAPPASSEGRPDAPSGEHATPAAQTEAASANAGLPPLTDQLKQLSDLHAQGALTDAEFAQAKSRLLGTRG